uniref:RNA polymerase subunit H/Rpb5 C-terminal domain-containing protein n=1 Tax=Lotus japonicus TaxID=34305 RepID=I3SA48_LOTJA|nr:unknown [Lotus japonicus]
MVAERVTGTTSLAEPHWKCSKTEATPFPPPKSNSPSLNSVIFCGPGVVKVTSIRNIAGQIVNKDTLSGVLLIVENNITGQALKAINLFSFKVEIFQITDLLVNITKHVLKPKHQVLTDRQKKNLLKKFNIEEKQLPRMLQSDAIARYYGL